VAEQNAHTPDDQAGPERPILPFCYVGGEVVCFQHPDYSPASEVQASALGGVQAGEAEVTENERTGLLFLKGK